MILVKQWFSVFFFILLALLTMVASQLNLQHSQMVRLHILDRVTPILTAITTPIDQINATADKIQNAMQIFSENERLRGDNQRLKIWHDRALLLQAENEKLRRLLDMPAAANISYVTAPVIGDSSDKFYKSLIVKAGAEDGITEDMPAITEKGLVGRTVDVGEKQSRILLLADWNSHIPVYIEKTNSYAVVAGRNNENPELIHLLGDAPIMDGMRVMTSGLGGVFPPGLPVGFLRKIDGKIAVIPYNKNDKLAFIRLMNVSSR